MAVCDARWQSARIALALAAILAGTGTPAESQVTHLEILSRQPATGGEEIGKAGAYQMIRGRVHGDVDPQDRRNAIIQDLALAPRNARGRVEYIATFALAERRWTDEGLGRADLLRSSTAATATLRRMRTATSSLVSGWQGDVDPTAVNQTITVPVATQAGRLTCHRPGHRTLHERARRNESLPIRLSSMGGRPPVYPPATDQPSATLTMSPGESRGGRGPASEIQRSAWAFADCTTTLFPGTPDPTQAVSQGRIRLANAVRARLHGEGSAGARHRSGGHAGHRRVLPPRRARRERQSESSERRRPSCGGDRRLAVRNFIKTFVHLGFNEDLQAGWSGTACSPGLPPGRPR